jgi:hypothetical protein
VQDKGHTHHYANEQKCRRPPARNKSGKESAHTAVTSIRAHQGLQPQQCAADPNGDRIFLLIRVIRGARVFCTLAASEGNGGLSLRSLYRCRTLLVDEPTRDTENAEIINRSRSNHVILVPVFSTSVVLIKLVFVLPVHD